MKTKTVTTTETKTTVELDEQDIIDLIKSAVGLQGELSVEFDVSSAGFLRGAIVTSTYTKVDY